MKILKYIRITVYVLILAGLIWLKFTNFYFGDCYIRTHLGFICPACGITRATEALLNLDFKSAISYNAYYVLILLPLFIIFFVNDIYCMITNKTSFVDIILRRRRKKYSCYYIYINCNNIDFTYNLEYI